MIVFTCENRGVSAQHTTRATPTQITAHAALSLCHPYLQQRCSVHPHHPIMFYPACDHQNRQNFPSGADLSESFASC